MSNLTPVGGGKGCKVEIECTIKVPERTVVTGNGMRGKRNGREVCKAYHEPAIVNDSRLKGFRIYELI